MIKIQEATEEDIPQLQEVAISTYHNTFAHFNTPENMLAYFEQAYNLKTLTDELHEPRSKLFIACEGDQLLGFARLRECDEVRHLLGENTVELQRLYVLTSAQGKSIGKLLMERALQYAVDNNYEWIWLGVWERNVKAQEFYKKWGFERFSEHTFWQGDDPQTDWLLKRKVISHN
jgi:ribosomal protein S18 acetylase RimI-like enzyme